MSRRSSRKPSEESFAQSPMPEIGDFEEGTTSSDDAGFPPFDLAAALQSVSEAVPPIRQTRRGRPPAGGRWPKKAPAITQTTFNFTMRGSNSLLKKDKSAVFVTGGVYELKCNVLTPHRENYNCKTVVTLFCEDEDKWAEMQGQMDSGFLMNGQPAPRQLFTMDKPSPRTHREVKAGRHSLEFTWDASGTIFVYLRFLIPLADLSSDPLPLRLCIRSHFVEEPHEMNMKSLELETVSHPSLLDTSLGSTGAIELMTDQADREIIEDPTRVLIFESPPDEDTAFVRDVINSVQKAVQKAGGNKSDSSPMALIEQAIHDSLQKPEEGGSTSLTAASLGEALFGNSSVGNLAAQMPNAPRPRGRPRKFHYPEYCYSKTALQKPVNPEPTPKWQGPTTAQIMMMQQMQQMQQHMQRSMTEVPEKRIKMEVLDEHPINMLNLINMNADDCDKPSSSMEDVDPNPEVKDFLTARKMDGFVHLFAKYTLKEMRGLSSENLRLICQNDSEALRLYHSLRQKLNLSGGTTKLRIFVAPKAEEDEEPCYELLHLTPPTVSELQNALESKGLIEPESVNRVCVAGPNGINVQISDEIIDAWSDSSVFQFTVSNKVLKLIQIE